MATRRCAVCGQELSEGLRCATCGGPNKQRRRLAAPTVPHSVHHADRIRRVRRHIEREGPQEAHLSAALAVDMLEEIVRLQRHARLLLIVIALPMLFALLGLALWVLVWLGVFTSAV